MLRKALSLVVLIGIVSLFADMAYEGARASTGPFLALLGTSGAVVGSVAGFGELIGTVSASFSGYIADRTHKAWMACNRAWFYHYPPVEPGDRCLHLGPISHGSGYLFVPICPSGSLNVRFDAKLLEQRLRLGQ